MICCSVIARPEKKNGDFRAPQNGRAGGREPKKKKASLRAPWGVIPSQELKQTTDALKIRQLQSGLLAPEMCQFSVRPICRRLAMNSMFTSISERSLKPSAYPFLAISLVPQFLMKCSSKRTRFVNSRHIGHIFGWIHSSIHFCYLRTQKVAKLCIRYQL